MYVITGATSRTGQQIARGLLLSGKRVRVIGRNAQRLQALVDLGAEPFIAEANDRVALTSALAGARAAWLMLQPNYIADSPDFRGFQDSVIRALSSALEGSTVTHAVVLSSWGASLAKGNGPVAGLHALEQMLCRHSPMHVLNLRPGYFMENTLSFTDSVLAEQAVLSPFAPDVVMPMVATVDVAQAALRYLLSLDFSGQQALELHGAHDLSLGQATAMLGSAIGQPQLPYRQIGMDAFRMAMLSGGTAANVADLMCEVVAAINSGLIHAEQRRSAASTGAVGYRAFMEQQLLPRLVQRRAA